jgi:membrane protease YdiL (CAAX protease family)
MPPAYRTATPRERLLAALLAVSAGTSLAVGCVPVAQSIVDSFVAPYLPGRAHVLAWLGCAAFPFLAGVFYFSFPRPKFPVHSGAWRSLPLAVLIAWVFGFLDGVPSFTFFLGSPETRLALAWALFFAPLGEELLFRGWLFSVSHRLWSGANASYTNPLPLAVWVSAGAFSLWHLQNWGVDSAPRVLFQTLYAFPVGLWLGWFRWRTGSLIAPLVAHWAINFATVLA